MHSLPRSRTPHPACCAGSNASSRQDPAPINEPWPTWLRRVRNQKSGMWLSLCLCVCLFLLATLSDFVLSLQYQAANQVTDEEIAETVNECVLACAVQPNPLTPADVPTAMICEYSHHVSGTQAHILFNNLCTYSDTRLCGLLQNLHEKCLLCPPLLARWAGCCSRFSQARVQNCNISVVFIDLSVCCKHNANAQNECRHCRRSDCGTSWARPSRCNRGWGISSLARIDSGFVVTPWWLPTALFYSCFWMYVCSFLVPRLNASWLSSTRWWRKLIPTCVLTAGAVTRLATTAATRFESRL